ncbi:ABC transporter substrate-binding protein [Peteryoungia ipomoeae]|uniref:Iron-siderophore ABC transporter substrate-binding protein n=1 Tax=Peteryoungia ipomoeae TaxID=1210932 RepID=A0A4S8NZ98_9HYPH|nr:ABC transporter substrate-binding protein [Peteryoungia ipomoeae]THV23050.1 iron-siderophore ABC transporter substrate-binding protein [Peteryoungia ipomoeae]
MSDRSYGRRAVLQLVAATGLAGLAAPLSRAAASSTGAAAQRLAAIDWAMLETACAIGHVPVAACELIRFRAESASLALPQDLLDLGLRGSPNFEQLRFARPDLILSSPFYVRLEGAFTAVAPVYSLPFFVRGEPSLPHALDALQALALRLDDPRSGERARHEAETRFDRLASRLKPHADRPVMLIDFGDSRHFRAFGFDSLYGSTLARLGLVNAWQGGTQFSFAAPVPIDRLAEIPDANFVIVNPVPIEARGQLQTSRLWNALPPVREGRVHQLGATNAFGGVPSALAFAEGLAEALAAA